MFSKFFEFVNVVDHHKIQSADEFLRVYGGQSFLNGMYRIFNANDVAKWTEMVHKSFPKNSGEIKVFGFDWLGRIFAMNANESKVLLFEPGTGEVLGLPASFI